MWLGKWPDADWNGKEYSKKSLAGKRAGKDLAGGYFCTIWAKICDLDNLNTNLGMRHHGANDPCNWCSCNISTRSWSQFGVDAAWLSHVYSSVDFLTQVLPVHPLFTLPGVTVHTLWPDLMHVKYMGVDMYLLAVFWFILSSYLLVICLRIVMASDWIGFGHTV